MVDTQTMKVPGSRSMNQFYTACIRGDHGTLHPDPEANELWISCNASFEVAIFDLDLQEVTARVPMPNGGSTHSGAFVHYPDGWNADGETQSDQSGLWGSALQKKRDIVAGRTGASGSGSIVDANVAPLSESIARGRDVFRTVAGIGCAGCHGKFAEGDLGVGPFTRGSSEGAIRAAISGVGEMAVVKNVITDEQIESVSAYLGYLGSNQVVRTLVKRGRFLPDSLSVRPGTNVQLIINNAGFSAYQFRSDNIGFEPMTIPARSLGTLDWQAPADEGTYTIYCADCKLKNERFTINVDADAKEFKSVTAVSSLNDPDNM